MPAERKVDPARRHTGRSHRPQSADSRAHALGAYIAVFVVILVLGVVSSRFMARLSRSTVTLEASATQLHPSSS